MSEQKYWVAFNIVRGIGPASFRALLEHFGSMRAAWEAPLSALNEVKIMPRARKNLAAAHKSLNLDRVMERVAEAGAHVLMWDDPGYPQALLNIDGSPPVLYVKGELTEADRWALGVVGTRKPTGYGRAVTRQLVETLARSGLTIVSGMAKGIDAEAHRAALEAGGRTIAVLGCGIDVTYPADHRSLAESIAQAGAVVSDYPMGTPPEGGNFPPRNRIISGLAMGVLVVEAGERSGALITADYAGSQGRDVFAVPGQILAKSSQGTNRLIQDGAMMVICADDILETLNMGMVIQQNEARETIPTEAAGINAKLMALLEAGPLHIDELCRQSALPIDKVSSDMAVLELTGQVRNLGNMVYALAAHQTDHHQPGIREANTRYVVD